MTHLRQGFGGHAPIATTSRKVRLFPPQLPPSRSRGGCTSPVAGDCVSSPQQGKAAALPPIKTGKGVHHSPQGETHMPRKATASIPHIHWRTREDWATAHPRFAPGPRLQRLGFKSQDMKHADGTWYSYEQATAFSKAVEAEAKSRQTSAKPAAVKTTWASAGKTLSQLCHAVFDLPEFSGRDLVDGKRIRPPLAKTTVKNYRYCATVVEQAAARMQEAVRARDSLWHAPAAALTPALMQALLNEVERHSGLATARHVRAFLSQLWSRLGKKEPGVNRHLFEDLDTMPTSPGRVTPWEPDQFWHMVLTADAMGLPAMADNFVWGVLAGFRQADRITMTRASLTESHITITPGKTAKKTGAIVQVKYAGLLRERQDAAWARRKHWPVAWPQLIADEKQQRPWLQEGSHFRHTFAKLRAAAAATMPACATLRDQDLRDTQQTWLDRANTDPELMALAAGHSFNRKLTAMQKRHYVAQNQHRLDAAFDLLNAYLVKHRPIEKKENEG
jgi:hypothetical protein